MAFDGVATENSGFDSGSVATFEIPGCGAGGSGCAAGGSAPGHWDEVSAVAARVGIRGSDGSLGINLLSMIKAKYKSYSMLAS